MLLLRLAQIGYVLTSSLLIDVRRPMCGSGAQTLEASPTFLKV